MKKIIAVSIMGYTLIGCISCGTGKKTVTHILQSTTAVQTTDSTQKLKLADTIYHTHTIQDSTVGISARYLSFALPAHSDIDTQAKVNNLRLHIYTDNRGRQHIDCSADSLTIVIARLIQDSIYQSHVSDSVYVAAQQAYYRDLSTEQQTVTKGYPVWRRMLDWLIAAIAGGILWELLKHLIKY